MKLLLRGDVDGVGKRGDIVEVADGYGRNFLIPRGLAERATAGVAGQAEAMRRARDVRDTQDRGAAEAIATSLVGRPVSIQHLAGEDGKLFGSVTAAEVAEATMVQTGIELDRKRMTITEPIRSLGSHIVMVKLHADVEFPLTVEVVEA